VGCRLFLGVAKVVGLQSPLHELDNLENAAYKVVCSLSDSCK